MRRARGAEPHARPDPRRRGGRSRASASTALRARRRVCAPRRRAARRASCVPARRRAGIPPVRRLRLVLPCLRPSGVVRAACCGLVRRRRAISASCKTQSIASTPARQPQSSDHDRQARCRGTGDLGCRRCRRFHPCVCRAARPGRGRPTRARTNSSRRPSWRSPSSPASGPGGAGARARTSGRCCCRGW